MAKFVDTNEPFEWMDYFGVNHPHLQGHYLCNICYIPFRFPSEIRVLSVSQPKIICFCRVVCRELCIFVPFFNCRSRPSPFILTKQDMEGAVSGEIPCVNVVGGSLFFFLLLL